LIDTSKFLEIDGRGQQSEYEVAWTDDKPGRSGLVGFEQRPGGFGLKAPGGTILGLVDTHPVVHMEPNESELHTLRRAQLRSERFVEEIRKSLRHILRELPSAKCGEDSRLEVRNSCELILARLSFNELRLLRNRIHNFIDWPTIENAGLVSEKLASIKKAEATCLYSLQELITVLDRTEETELYLLVAQTGTKILQADESLAQTFAEISRICWPTSGTQQQSKFQGSEFPCAQCQKTALVVGLLPAKTEHRFLSPPPGQEISGTLVVNHGASLKVLDVHEYERAHTALSKSDLQGIYKMSDGDASLWCELCDKLYCFDHWGSTENSDEREDCAIEAVCPQGHRQFIHL
jgi:hypothetical protein